MQEVKLSSDLRWDLKLEANDETSALTSRTWPNYLIETSDIEEPLPATSLSDDELTKRFLMWGIRSQQTNQLLAYASAILIPVDITQTTLSDDGWRYAERAFLSSDKPNCLCLLSASIDPDFRNLNLSYALLEQGKVQAKNLGLPHVVAPVRPTKKEKFPFESMETYLNRRIDENEVFDPWVRTHIKSGGKTLNICSRSVEVKASLSKWREWTGLELRESGEYLLPKGLVPLKVDLTQNIGTYSEPNVWVRYQL